MARKRSAEQAPPPETIQDLAGMSPAQRYRAMSTEAMAKKFPNSIGEKAERKVEETTPVLVPDLGQQWAIGRPGFMCGKVMYIIGEEGVSKSARALYLANLCLKQGGLAAFIDWEHALTDELCAAYIENPDELVVYRPGCLEEGMEMKREIFKNFGEVDPDNQIPKICIGDSLGGSVSSRTLEDDREMGDQRVGGSGLYMSTAVPYLNTLAVKYNILDIYIGQARMTIETGFSGPPKPYVDRLVVKGGKAIPFQASYWEILKRGATLKDSEKNKNGFTVNVYYKKNKPRVPFREFSYDVEWFKGISHVPHTMDMLALGNICGMKVQRKRYWCEEVGVQESSKLSDEEMYEIVHRPENIVKFQRELDIKPFGEDSGQTCQSDTETEPQAEQ